MDKVRKVSYSLKQNCKLRLRGLFEDLQRANKDVTSFLLVTDAYSLRILSSFMKMMELMELNILAVERIDNVRTPYPKQHAIYFLSCDMESVDFLLNDFRDKKSATYGKVHLFFLNRVSSEIMTKLSANQILLERVISFKEFNQDFACKFDNIFNLEMKNDLKSLYQSSIAEFKTKAKEIGDKLATVIFSFEKLYGVEIMFNQTITTDTNVSQHIAESAQLRINEVIQKLQSEKSEQLDPQAGKITLVIIDRAFDPLTPIIRDYYYQPMLYDILESQIDNDIITYQMQDEKQNKLIEKKAQLNEQDDLFQRFFTFITNQFSILIIDFYEWEKYERENLLQQDKLFSYN